MGAVTTVHGVVAHLFLPGAANEQVLLPSISEIMCMSTPVHVKHVFSISIIFHVFFLGAAALLMLYRTYQGHNSMVSWLFHLRDPFPRVKRSMGLDDVYTTSFRASRGQKFQREKNYQPKIEFAYRMCAGPSTSALPKPNFLSAPSFSYYILCLVVVFWW